MKCPRCNSTRSAVTDSRSDESAIRRRRECQECNFRFSTFERVEYSLPAIIKKGGSRQVYKSEKLRAGIERACEKRPVSVETVDSAIENIEKKLQELCVKEIASTEVGNLVMEALKEIDQVAYVRFASVYRAFSDVSDFVDTLENLKSEPLESTVKN